MNVYPLHHGVSFHPLLLGFCLQIAYRKVKNLRIGVDNLLHHAKSAACVVSIIIDAPAIAYAHSQ